MIKIYGNTNNNNIHTDTSRTLLGANKHLNK